ncbi:chlorophyllase [Solwaraspora sp. WMMD406]|uniref:alpha/beta hydrolase family protein n=1 Tax=Solwaraspora sp. WMMD406 TaxID=3016095 RepID=UPI002417F8F4|nr:chlorophyllase [Solwaraspora sp. WMMD406]MDG4767616.1 chlorophyllase [Solwaraspora sp. WMMD406]
MHVSRRSGTGPLTGGVITAGLITASVVALVAGCGTAPEPAPVFNAPVTVEPTPAGSTPAESSPANSSPANSSPAAGRTAPTDELDVDSRTLDLNRDGDRPLPVTVWYPVTGADTTTERFPVVLFSHGLGGNPADYEAILTAWAAAGFVVAAPTYPYTSQGGSGGNALDVLNQPADASYVLDELLALDGRDGDPFAGRLDVERVAAAGHSAGGITTVGLFTAARDERLDAGIVLAGSALGVGSAFSGAAAPQLFIHGELDEVVSYASGKAAYERVPWPKAMLTLPDGDHGQSLLRPGNPAYDVVLGSSTDFLRWTLYGDDGARQRLTEAPPAGLAVLDDQL